MPLLGQAPAQQGGELRREPTILTPAPDSGERLRLERLATLADVWGRAYLFHPAVAARQLDWSRVVQRAIPAVERARTSAEFVAALNTHVLAPLGDPLSFAVADSTVGDPKLAAGPPAPLRLRTVAPGLRLLILTDARVFGAPQFLAHFDSLHRQLGEGDTLVVDLRWGRQSSHYLAGEWLRFFTDTTVLLGATVGRQHAGWAELPPVTCCPYPYEERWLTREPLPLRPIRESGSTVAAVFPGTGFDSLLVVRAPTVFLTDRTSYAALERELDAVQRPGRTAVVLDTSGTSRPEGDFVQRYPDGVVVRLQMAQLVARDGALGGRPDTVLAGTGGEADFARLARAVLTRRPPSARPAFRYSLWHPGPEPPSSALPTREQRIHDVMKIWTVLSYLDLHLEHAALDWGAMLREWIPRVEAADSTVGYFSTLRRLAARLNDSHVGVTPPRGAEPAPFFTIPARVAALQGRLYVVQLSPAVDTATTPLRIGDEVLAIDGVPAERLGDPGREMLSASTEGAMLRDLSLAGYFGSRGAQNSPARVTLRRAGRIMTLTVPRSHRRGWAPVPDPRETTPTRRLPGDVGYVNLKTLRGDAHADSVMRALHDTRGLILDLRGGPIDGEGALLRWLAERPARTIWETPVVDAISGPVSRAVSRQEVVWPLTRPAGWSPYRGPVVLLVNERTQSLGESVVMYFHSARSVITVGDTTAGTTTNVTPIYLSNGFTLQFTYARALHPDGRPFHNVGILPDVPVEPTAAGIMAGRDEVLEAGRAAIEREAGQHTAPSTRPVRPRGRGGSAGVEGGVHPTP